MSLLMLFRSGPKPPVIPRETDGKIFVLDNIHGFVFGTMPYVKEACSLIFNVGPGVPRPNPVIQFIFITPLGQMQLGDPNFAFQTDIPIFEQFPFGGFPAGQCLVYTFAFGELGMVGRWGVSVTVGGFQSQTAFFTVTPAPGPNFQFQQQ